MNHNIEFSLVVPTLNRVQALEQLFQSLLVQDFTDFEVIVVDQNKDDRLVELVNTYSKHFPILHLRESIRGQSRARNIGFQHLKGNIVAFPDDDCIYPRGILQKVARFFEENEPYDGLLTRVFDLEEDENAFKNCGDEHSQEVDYWKAYRVAISCGIFLRASVVNQVRFDETLGPGAGTPWTSGDETDFMFKCLKADFRFYYDTNLVVRHPNPLTRVKFKRLVQRAYPYGIGHGYFLATHDFLSSKILRGELNDEFSQVFPKLFKGDWRMACYSLVKGIGTYRGYWAGRKTKSKANSKLKYNFK